MNITVEELGAIKRKLTVDLPPEAVAEAVENVVAKLAKGARVKGFRPGKAPKSVVKNVYKSQINHEVTDHLISTNLSRALEEKELTPAASPTLEAIDWAGDSTGFTFTVSFEIKPVFDPVGWDQLSLTKIKPEVKEERIDQRLEEIRRNMAPVVTVEDDRPLKASEDLAMVSYQAYEDGQPLEKLAASNALIEMGVNRFLPEFEAGLAGLKAGESRDIPVTFPEDYQDESLRGKNVVFKATLNQIKHRDKPPLDDDFIKDLGLEGIETLEEFKAKLRNDFQRQAELQAAADLDNQVQRLLADLVEFEVPASLVDREAQSMVNQFKSRVGRNGLSLEKIGLKASDLKTEYAGQATRNVKVALIVEKIAEDQKIEISQEEIEAELARQAGQYKRPVAEIKDFYASQGLLDNLVHQLKIGKTFKMIKEKASISEREAPAEGADE